MEEAHASCRAFFKTRRQISDRIKHRRMRLSGIRKYTRKISRGNERSLCSSAGQEDECSHSEIIDFGFHIAWTTYSERIVRRTR